MDSIPALIISGQIKRETCKTCVGLPHLRLGVTRYAPSGSAEEVFRALGLDTAHLRQSIANFQEQAAPVR